MLLHVQVYSLSEILGVVSSKGEQVNLYTMKAGRCTSFPKIGEADRIRNIYSAGKASNITHHTKLLKIHIPVE